MAKTILFIEDEMHLQQTLAGRLKQENLEMLSALNGEIGLRMAKEKSPDLIVLDLILPKKDGFEVLKELKTGPETSSIPVIVLTNLEGVRDIERALSLGAFTYLVKANYSLDDMVNKIKQTLGEKSEARNPKHETNSKFK